VHDQQQRNGQAETELPCFARRKTQVPPAVETIEPEQPVHEKRRVEDELAGTGLPGREQGAARGLHCGNGADAECVIEQV
jgi:hypothetical protein